MSMGQDGTETHQPHSVDEASTKINGHTEEVHDIDTDVLIVGAGVTGLTLAGLLAAAGVKAFTIAKHRGTAPSPRAHVTNQRTMEVFRDMGIEKRVVDVSTRMPLELGNGVMCTSLTGMELARYSCYGAGPHHMSDFAMASPCEMINVGQHILEKVLLEHAREKGAEIRFSNELIDIEQSPEGVKARIRERQTQIEYTVRARYAIGADGGRSLMAEKFGFGFEGEPGLMNMLTSWLEVDLTQYTAYRPACIYMMARPGNAYWVGSGTLVVVKPFTEWLLNRQYPADAEPDISDKAIIEYARTVLGVPNLKIHVKDTSKWQVNNVYATENRRGRIFLAGDAAHRHPPASGLGSNTCIQDAYNLAWKLKLVCSGKAGDRLLESYHSERQPIAKQIVGHAIQTLYGFAKVPEALGFQQGQSEEEGYKSLEELFSDAPVAEQRRGDLRKAVDLQNRRSNALGLQLGQRYSGSVAVVDDGTPFPALKRDPVLHYEMTTHPGGYLPHVWVEHKTQAMSTLDIAGHGQFSLIVGIGGACFVAAAQKVSKEFGIELPVYSIGYQCTYNDVRGDWTGVREMGDKGALLVRPDRHIAWRCMDRPENPTEALRSALGSILS